MSTVATILSAVGYRLGGGITISASSDPAQATCIQWMNETALWLTGLCAENDSDLGRAIGTITTINAAITAATAANPCQITAASHGLMTSGTAEVLVRGVSGMTDLNDKEYTATYVSGNAVTLGIDSSAYSAYTSGGYITKRKYGDLAANIYCPAHMVDKEGNYFDGWLVKEHSRDPLFCTTEDAVLDYDPVEADEPSQYYIDGSNNICFPSYPDDVYTVKIPYYQMPTVMTGTTDTMPFLGLFDNVFIEALTWRAQNRDEYDVTTELKWQSFLLDRARAVISMRRRMRSSVGI